MHAEGGGWVGEWSPGIGDPTVMGWVTVGAYAVSAVLCAIAARRERRNDNTQVWAFWAALALLYFALGINKQLDLQSLMTELGRINARAWGWYDQRRLVQIGLIATLVVLGAVGIAALIWTAPWRSGDRTVALVGTVMLIVFVIARATSFSRMDQLIGTEWLGMRANWLLELPGIVIAGAGAATATLRSRAHRADRT